ncbi:MAG TPA: chloride channel protein [Chryseosolibacter sp.]|nr:chloride channel protein [Chryseosolibacter sp.]
MRSDEDSFARYGETPRRVKRTLYISSLALINAVIVGFIAKGLLYLINLFTNFFFYGRVSIHESTPSGHDLGYWVIAIPALGGLIVGLMARFGSKAIRGHGIPEAMEKVITNESRIHPMITVLKPLSAAVSIGTGGPFGAEGPIISTGGALGSFCGQTLNITAQERKVLLAAGATAGMTAIFGTPFAAILLAIELLLFEFSARSFIPVMIACVTGACMHFLLFGTEPVFPMPDVPTATSQAVVFYALMGILIGGASVIVTRILYLIEDAFEKLPVHWMWWPAIGGLFVGLIGTFAPQTLGVGYENITAALSGELTVTVLVTLCFWKFASWSIALGSGTSGGTLAPLLTIGSAMGCLLGIAGQLYFPNAGISLPMSALVGMAALFAGSARALLTSIVFALESTMQESTLLPLIAGCVTAYLISFIFMRGTIMTEKIKRKGVIAPEQYLPDLLEITSAGTVATPVNDPDIPMMNASMTVSALRQWFQHDGIHYPYNTVFVLGLDNAQLAGIVDKRILFEITADAETTLAQVMSRKVYSVYADNSLHLAVEFMLKTGQNILPVFDRASRSLKGFVTQSNVLEVFGERIRHDEFQSRHISMVSATLRVISKSKRYFASRIHRDEPDA